MKEEPDDKVIEELFRTNKHLVALYDESPGLARILEMVCKLGLKENQSTSK